MLEKNVRYLTTTLPYVNSDPHIGHAYEIVCADALARLWRESGHEVFFNTGTDEHGQKIARKADEKGIDRQAYVDHFAGEFEKLGESLNLSFDNFIRTTNETHKLAAQELWRRCEANGDIYKKKYSGLYCVGCEAFIAAGDLVDGKCPDHDQVPELIEEENYFFKLSNYQDYLKEHLSQSGVIEPEWRRLEALTFVDKGLEDFSISREKTRLNWGVEVPDDEDQVMYVWFDALTNYISTLGWPSNDANFQKFWQAGEVTQLAGKDQIRFQSIIWQAMLKSANIKATDKIFYHGFINSGGQKMSKSIGNVISPYELITRYGNDATRYLLLRHIHPFEDTDITWDRLDEWYTANLVNGLGNLVARVTNMAEKYVPTEKRLEFSEVKMSVEFMKAIDEFRLDNALNIIWQQIGLLDQQIQDTEPFKLVKVDEAKAIEIVNGLMVSLYEISSYLKGFMPQTAVVIKRAVVTYQKPTNLFARIEG